MVNVKGDRPMMHQITARISEDHMVWVKDEARRQKRSIGDVLRQLIEKAMQEGNKEV